LCFGSTYLQNIQENKSALEKKKLHHKKPKIINEICSINSSYILNTLAGYVPVIEYIWLLLFQVMYFRNS